MYWRHACWEVPLQHSIASNLLDRLAVLLCRVAPRWLAEMVNAGALLLPSITQQPYAVQKSAQTYTAKLCLCALHMPAPSKTG